MKRILSIIVMASVIVGSFRTDIYAEEQFEIASDFDEYEEDTCINSSDSEKDIEKTANTSESETDLQTEHEEQTTTETEPESESEQEIDSESTEVDTEETIVVENEQTESEVETEVVDIYFPTEEIDGQVDDEAAVSWGDEISAFSIQTVESDYNMLALSGNYYTESADKILKRINEIRYEACKEGLINPQDGKTRLTLEDYHPLKWSADMEAIARLRAAEACVARAHTRPNGKSCFTINTENGEQSWAENLAWNWDGLMRGIEQFYEEKKAYVNKTGGQTGHYTSMISPRYYYVGMGTYRLKSGGWYVVAQEFSYKSSGLDETKDSFSGDKVQCIEVADRAFTEFSAKNMPKKLMMGSKGSFETTGSVLYNFSGTPDSYSGKVISNSWQSSDDTILSIDKKGNWQTFQKEGTVKVSAEINGFKVEQEIYVYDPANAPIEIVLPKQTTYKVGDKLNLSGGSVKEIGESKGVNLTTSNTKGFDSSKAGICTLTVTFNGYEKVFDVLIIEEPKCNAQYGQKLSEVVMPSTPYGRYYVTDEDRILNDVGKTDLLFKFVPNDTDKFTTLQEIGGIVQVSRQLTADTEVELIDDKVIYNGTEQEPKVNVSFSDKRLIEQKDYTLTYANNCKVGQARITITGVGNYTGSIIYNFEIEKAPIKIVADTKRIAPGDALPSFTYHVEGLLGQDKLIKEPTITCEAASTQNCGKYEIKCSNANAGTNYSLTYQAGELIVAKEAVYYSVDFDFCGHGVEAVSGEYSVIPEGTLVTEPKMPVEEGYSFNGWYKDKSFTKPWNFDKDTVQNNMVLYAKWLKDSSTTTFRVQTIQDMEYTGKACKPIVTVYDGQQELKQGKDYTISYKNNINANVEGMQKIGDGSGEDFKEALPYVQIKGKGNYNGDLCLNFNINKAEICNKDGNPVSGVVVNDNSQLLINATKKQKVINFVKYGTTLKLGRDYEIKLLTKKVYNELGVKVPTEIVCEEGMVPKGYSGVFSLQIIGKGNYTGVITRTIYVTDKEYLMKNVTIKLGSKQKTLQYQNNSALMVLNAGYYDVTTKEYYFVDNGKIQSTGYKRMDDMYTVQSGKNYLIEGRDYDVTYINNDRVGTATMILEGKGRFMGSKSITFKITGKTFNSGAVTVEGLRTSMEYTGAALTQNDVQLIYQKGKANECQLVYGIDYVTSYTRNIDKGTATVSFIGNPQAGYSGKFNKTFKITTPSICDINAVTNMNPDISVPYDKAGVKPYSEIHLISALGKTLIYGKDYTVSYENNRKVSGATDEKPPVMVVRGKGNYCGTLRIPYTIIGKNLTNEVITVNLPTVLYQEKTKADKNIAPKITVKDGKTSLREKTDYTITYINCKQNEVKDYLEAWSKGEAVQDKMPQIVITALQGSGYVGEITCPLSVYMTKLQSTNLYTVVSASTYNTTSAKPRVRVYYGTSDIVKKAKGLVSDSDIKQLGLQLLEEGADYKLIYGNNNSSGRNKGSVTIIGIAPRYGGEIKVNFTIDAKQIDI